MADKAGLVAQGGSTGQKVGRLAKLSCPGKKRCLDKRQPGKRGYLGPWDRLRQERLAVSEWAQAEEQLGHRLGRQDLFTVFRKMVQFKADCLEKQQTALADLQEELPELDQRTLSFCKERLASWQKARPREKACLKLLAQCGFREKATNRQTKLTEAEEAELLMKA